MADYMVPGVDVGGIINLDRGLRHDAQARRLAELQERREEMKFRDALDERDLTRGAIQASPSRSTIAGSIGAGAPSLASRYANGGLSMAIPGQAAPLMKLSHMMRGAADGGAAPDMQTAAGVSAPSAGGAAMAPAADAPLPPAAPVADPALQPAPPPSIHLDPEGLQRLAERFPETAMKLTKMDAAQRAATHKNLQDHLAFESQVIGSIMATPEAERPAAYRRIRADLTARGVEGLPAEWDEKDAVARQHMGLTAMQAFSNQRADERLSWDEQDDDADNARADRNVDSMIGTRGERVAISRDAVNRTDARGRRGQDIYSADRRRGQDIVDARDREIAASGGRRRAPASTSTPAYVDATGRAAAGGASLPMGSPLAPPPAPRVVVNPKTGERLQLVNGKWVPAR